MGMTLFYTGGKQHSLSDRLKDMKHMLMQQEEYDLSTDEGKENTWHAVNSMLLGAGAAMLGMFIGDKIGNKIYGPIIERQERERIQNAFKNGQLAAYRSMMKNPAYLMNRAFIEAEKDPKFEVKHF